MKDGRKFECRDCGRVVVWMTSKKGHRYLAQPLEWSGSETFAQRVYYPRHECNPTIEERAMVAARAEARAAEIAEKISNGEIVKGQRVEVVKGRKVPKGTTGIVFWIADAPDAYDVIKVGFTTDEGVKHFTNVQNVAVAK
jgi:hypothetical protein